MTYFIPFYDKKCDTITKARRIIMDYADVRYAITDRITFRIIDGKGYVERMKYASGRFGWVSDRGKPKDLLKRVDDRGRLMYQLDRFDSNNIKKEMI